MEECKSEKINKTNRENTLKEKEKCCKKEGQSKQLGGKSSVHKVRQVCQKGGYKSHRKEEN
jgi:hypothetical protein